MGVPAHFLNFIKAHCPPAIGTIPWQVVTSIDTYAASHLETSHRHLTGRHQSLSTSQWSLTTRHQSFATRHQSITTNQQFSAARQQSVTASTGHLVIYEQFSSSLKQSVVICNQTVVKCNQSLSFLARQLALNDRQQAFTSAQCLRVFPLVTYCN